MKTYALTAIVSLALSSAVSAQELTVVSWGGALQDAQTKAFIDPFAKEKGVKITQDSWSGELAKLRAMVDGGNVVWDVVDMDPQTAAAACESGLLERIGEEAAFKATNLVPGGLTPCAVGTSTYATVLAYDKKAFSEAPTSTTDIFDSKKFPGKRAMRKSPVDALELALVADGVPAGEVYNTLSTSEGVDRAFKKLDTIKSDIVWWDAGAQPAQMLKSGEVKMALAWNGRIADANAKEKADLGIGWSDQIRGFDMWTIPSGAKNADIAREFILSSLEPETNAELSKYVAYGPVTEAAAKLVPAEIAPNLPSAPENSKGALAQDGAFWGKNSETLNARFSSWISQ
ncbi:ABC transporter substrate-binding protein [Phyllobacterium zundukense]|uniref:ABC transporter substrate-binding protein n=1 Tax=Phyllobacterium zundukense TaxID=1867719 RepID=A0A2N9W0N1_9HYPH|nr:ABC transporter substrate-binding protein [Phyllobacterium zundukense]ATU95454.1 ABC transporter substrate-binding protein [Phyllobacterium zundukense]PIO45299.1 ABC transporter substrate-binding protein [Phyllobacterium zundukense]